MRISLLWLLLSFSLCAACSWSDPSPVEQATELFRMAQWDAAIELCDQMLAEAPEGADVRLLRGRCYVGKEMPDMAIVDYTEAIRLAPEDPEPLYHRAIAYRLLGKNELARNDVSRAGSIDPEMRKAFAMRYSSEDSGSLLDDSSSASQQAEDRRRSHAAKDAEPDDNWRADGWSDDWSDDWNESPDPYSSEDGRGLATSTTGLSEPQVVPHSAIPAPGKTSFRPRSPHWQDSKLSTQPRHIASRFDAESSQNDNQETRPNWLPGQNAGKHSRFAVPRPGDNRGLATAEDAQDKNEQPSETDSEDADAPASDAETSEPKDAQPEAEPPPPILPSGRFLLPNHNSALIPQTGYPYLPSARTPRDSSSYLSRLYSVPGTGLPEPMTAPAPNPAYAPSLPTTNQRPGRRGPRAYSRGVRPGMRIRPGQTAGPRMGTTGPMGSTEPMGNRGGGMARTAPPNAGPQVTLPGQPPRASLGPPATSRGLPLQMQIPFPPGDLPTTGVVHAYDDL